MNLALFFERFDSALELRDLGGHAENELAEVLVVHLGQGFGQRCVAVLGEPLDSWGPRFNLFFHRVDLFFHFGYQRVAWAHRCFGATELLEFFRQLSTSFGEQQSAGDFILARWSGLPIGGSFAERILRQREGGKKNRGADRDARSGVFGNRIHRCTPPLWEDISDVRES